LLDTLPDARSLLLSALVLLSQPSLIILLPALFALRAEHYAKAEALRGCDCDGTAASVASTPRDYEGSSVGLLTTFHGLGRSPNSASKKWWP
jgi:hypothetical protein